MDRGVPEVAHRVVVARVVLHGLRVIADEVRRLLDLAERLDPVLADLEGHDRGVVHQPVADELGGAAQDRQPLLPGRRGPRRLGGSCSGDRRVDVGRGGGRERPEEDVPVDRRAGLEGAVAVSPLPVDEVAVPLPERRADMLGGGFERAVELLVVGPQRGVGDLDPRLRLGGHAWQSLVCGTSCSTLRSV